MLAFLALSIALHVLVLLLARQPLPQVTVEPPPLTVRLAEQPPVVPPMKETSRPEPAAVRPRPQHHPQPRPQPLAEQEPAPAPALDEAPAPPAVVTAPQSSGAPQVAAPPAEPPKPIPVTPPLYNAAYLSNPPPDYPVAARRRGQEGTVLLSVLVSEAGLPKEIRLAKSSGTPVLDEAALEAVKGWKFVPARQGAQSVAAWVEVPIRFRLETR
ncbi:MAG TPA: energy transducer TonB [Burkholderiales bacterium]|nr:energy transducer TonB [Burkholderiales bacterium]